MAEYAPMNHSEKRSIVLLLVNAFFSAAASTATVTALGILVYEITRRELDLGLLGLFEFAPAFLLVLLTGSVADRLDRRKVGAVALIAEAAIVMVIALYTHSTKSGSLPLFVLVFSFGIARAFVSPAVRSLRADILPAVRLPWLTARYTACLQAGTVAGPVVAGYLYTIDRTMPFYAVVVALSISAVSVWFIKTEASLTRNAVKNIGDDQANRPARGHLSEALEGFRFVRRTPILLGAMSLDLFAVLFGGAIALLPALGADTLHVDASGVGWLRASAGIGAGFMTLGLVAFPVRRHVGPVLFSVIVVFGVMTIMLGITRSYLAALIFVAVLSAADSVSMFIRQTITPLVTPRPKRGRVLAIENVFIGASNELGAFESGVAGQILGAGGAVVFGGLGTLVVAAVWAMAFPPLRSLDEFPRTDTATEEATA